MKKFLLIFLILLVPKADCYVSPESYAVNEADFTDYRYAAPSPKLNLDNLDDERFQAPNIVEADFEAGSNKSVSQKEEELQNEFVPNKKKLSYKFAKWWVDQRYKREEAHHGTLHEIKVDKRIEYEKRQQEALAAKMQAKAQVIDYAEEQTPEYNEEYIQEESELNVEYQQYAPNPALFL